jgi:hypothetical protein
LHLVDDAMSEIIVTGVSFARMLQIRRVMAE